MKDRITEIQKSLAKGYALMGTAIVVRDVAFLLEKISEYEARDGARMSCGHLKAEWVTDQLMPGFCRGCERERTAREEGFKAGLKAAAEKRCRFCDDGMVIVNGEHVNSSGNGIPCGAQDILALPVTEIASRGK